MIAVEGATCIGNPDIEGDTSAMANALDSVPEALSLVT